MAESHHEPIFEPHRAQNFVPSGIAAPQLGQKTEPSGVCGAAGAGCCAPQAEQNWEPAGTGAPQLGHGAIPLSMFT